MTPALIARLALLAAAIILFIISARTGQDVLRYVAIGLLVVAVILRFVGRGRPPGDPPAR
jgi:uncharacterized membrane protein YGL010W